MVTATTMDKRGGDGGYNDSGGNYSSSGYREWSGHGYIMMIFHYRD